MTLKQKNEMDWNRRDISKNTDADFSHGICLECYCGTPFAL